jgi:hypothetical protein
MKTKTHFQFRLDLWDAAGENILEHVADIDDFEIATAAYHAALGSRVPGIPPRGRGIRQPDVRTRVRRVMERRGALPTSFWRLCRISLVLQSGIQMSLADYGGPP